MSPAALIAAAHAPLPDGALFPSDAFADDLHDPVRAAALAEAAIALLGTEDADEFRLAVHVGSGDVFADALLDRLEAGPVPARDDALLALLAWEFAADPLRNGRAGAILAEADRFDLLVCLLGRADPHGMTCDAFEQAAQRPPLDPHLVGLVAAALAADRPEDLPRAAAVVRGARGLHATFLDAARDANPRLPGDVLDAVRDVLAGRRSR